MQSRAIVYYYLNKEGYMTTRELQAILAKYGKKVCLKHIQNLRTAYQKRYGFYIDEVNEI